MPLLSFDCVSHSIDVLGPEQVQDLSRLVEGMGDDAFGRRYRRLSAGGLSCALSQAACTLVQAPDSSCSTASNEKRAYMCWIMWAFDFWLVCCCCLVTLQLFSTC